MCVFILQKPGVTFRGFNEGKWTAVCIVTALRKSEAADVSTRVLLPLEPAGI